LKHSSGAASRCTVFHPPSHRNRKVELTLTSVFRASSVRLGVARLLELSLARQFQAGGGAIRYNEQWFRRIAPARIRKSIMAKTYLQVTPVPGKWYVSDRFQAISTRWQILDPSKAQPKRSTSEMILAGPFDSRDLAAKWNSLTCSSGYIWEREIVEESHK
jgi:hypothetical protein